MSKYKITFKKVIEVEAEDEIEAELVAIEQLEEETNHFEEGAQALDITIKKIKYI